MPQPLHRFTAETVAELDIALDEVSADWKDVDGFEFEGVIVPSRSFKVAVEALRAYLYSLKEG